MEECLMGGELWLKGVGELVFLDLLTFGFRKLYRFGKDALLLNDSCSYYHYSGGMG